MIKVQCSGCQKTYSIPDEKIPADKDLDLPCPACKTIIKIRKNGSVEPPPPSGPTPGGEALMKSIIKNSRALPPMPQIIAKATEVLSSENSGFREVGEVLETDQAMATRVLKLANSAYYAVPVPVSTVQQASALLGYQTLMELITVVSTSKMMGKALAGYDISAESVWRHSLSVAIGAKAIAEKKFPTLVNDAFNAGLIHDSGMLILDDHVSKNKDRFVALINRGSSVQDAEQQIFGFDHALIASIFFKKWKLPPSQTHAICYHHQPSESGGDALSCLLHAADILANREEVTEKNFVADEKAMNFVGLSDDEWENLAEEVRTSVAHIMSTMK